MTSSQIRHRLLNRLYHDLQEIENNPYPGISVFTNDANIRRFCLVLTPPAGPWQGLPLHFIVKLIPGDWPTSPPVIYNSFTGLDHPNVLGNLICCDLLGNQPTHYRGGYSPALTLGGLFIQLLAFFSSRKIEQAHDGVIDIGDPTLVSYVWEEGLDQHLPPDARSCRISTCVCADSVEQLLLSVLWTNEKNEGTMVQHRKGHQSKYIETQRRFLYRLEWPNPRRISILSTVEVWSCRNCPYRSLALRPALDALNELPKHSPSLRIQSLDDTALYKLSLYLPLDSIIALNQAFPHFRKIVESHHLLRRRELVCFFLRISLEDTLLGIGNNIARPAGTLSSGFDWLSLEAFDVYKVQSILDNQPLHYFLPLAFTEFHFRKAESEVWMRLLAIYSGVQVLDQVHSKKLARPLEPPDSALQRPHSVTVLYRMMNDIVVILMQSCNAIMQSPNQGPTILHVSEKAIISYCHLLHLFAHLCHTTPQILDEATVRIHQFIATPKNRVKAVVPNLGEFIVMAMMVFAVHKARDDLRWETLCDSIISELLTRNVRWVLQEFPELEVIETGESEYRLNNTFAASETSLRLILFQSAFFKLFRVAYPTNIVSELDGSYGFPEKSLPGKMVEQCAEIYRVGTLFQFFYQIWGQQVTETLSVGSLSEMLRHSLQESGERGYHTVATSKRMQKLKHQRR